VNTRERALRFVLAATILSSVLVCLSIACPVGAKLTVTGVTLVADAIPGSTFTHRITANIGSADSPTQVVATIRGLGQAADGSFYQLTTSEDASAYSATQFLTLDRASAAINPGELAEFTANVAIPASVGDGGRYGLINLATGSGDTGAVIVSSAINIPVLLTIAGSELVHTGTIDRVSVDNPIASQPIHIETLFTNKGNHHYRITNEVSILDHAGTVLDTAHLDMTGNSLIPTATRRLEVIAVPENPIEPGSYSVKSKVALEDGTILDERMSQFDVSERYTPPPPPAQIMLSSSADGTLWTNDGVIKVDFPAGSVLEEANVALRPFGQDQLPKAQGSLRLGTTAFRLEGINGLLAKNASIELKYSQSDLNAAGGDVSRLVLARWDKANTKWALLDTKRDAKTKTLRANTNQLGMLSVMVLESGPSGVPWAQFGLVAGVVVVCSAAVLSLSRRRRS
jgi:hypothetical protein